MAHGLWLSVSSNVVVATTFVALGVMFLRRRGLPRPDRLALLAFSAWWFLFAASAALAAWRGALLASGIDDADLHENVWIVENTVSVLALWGLAAYVNYLVRGMHRGMWVWALAVGLLALSYAVAVHLHDVVAVHALHWSTGRTFLHPPPIWELVVLVGGYYGTLVTLAVRVAYATREIDDPTVRLRSLSLMWGIVFISVLGFIGLVVPGDTPLGPMQSVLRIAAAGVVWFGYFPPASIRQSWRVRSLGQ